MVYGGALSSRRTLFCYLVCLAFRAPFNHVYAYFGMFALIAKCYFPFLVYFLSSATATAASVTTEKSYARHTHSHTAYTFHTRRYRLALAEYNQLVNVCIYG